MHEPGMPVVIEGGPAEISGPKSVVEFASCAYRWTEALSGVEAHWEHEQLTTGQQNILLGRMRFQEYGHVGIS